MHLFPYKQILVVLLAASLFSACKKDKVPTPTPPIVEKSKFELIPGEYRMYDTLGNYLGYDMTIEHWFGIDSTGFKRDTFLFENFDGQFNFSYFQSDANIVNWPKNYFYIGFYDPIIDTLNKRWHLMGYDGYYDNDSIHLIYRMVNIKYYLQDLTPYLDTVKHCIGVKI